MTILPIWITIHFSWGNYENNLHSIVINCSFYEAKDKRTSNHEYTKDDLIPQKLQKGENNQQINVGFNFT